MFSHLRGWFLFSTVVEGACVAGLFVIYCVFMPDQRREIIRLREQDGCVEAWARYNALPPDQQYHTQRPSRFPQHYNADSYYQWRS